MADNVAITAGSGTSIATDQVGSDHYQCIKLVDGTADSSTVVAVDVGVKANALRVAPANDITDGTYIGDIKFGEAEPNSADILTAVQLIDNAISGTEMQVDIVADGAGLATDAKLDAIIADTDAIETAVELLDNAVDGNYLNVNVNAAGTDLTMNAGVLTAQTQRVTIATDDEVNNLLGTIDADTGAIKTAVELIDNAISGSEMQVDIVADGAGLATDAKLDDIIEDTNAIQLAVQIMDDWDDGSDHCEVVGAAAEDAAVAGAPLLAGGRYDTTARELDNGDAGAVALGVDGGVVLGRRPYAWSATINSADASSATSVKAAGGAGKRHYITSLVISVGSAMNVQIQDDAGTPNVAVENMYFAANGGLVYSIPPGSAIEMGADNQDIDVITSGAGNISVVVTGYTI